MHRLVSCLLTVAGCLPAQPAGSHVPVETRVWVATKIYSAIQVYFAHAEGAPQFDLDRDYQGYLKSAFQTDDRRAFDLATMAFIAKLRNGHSGFYDDWLVQQYGQDLGFALQPMGEGWVVVSSRISEVNPGDIVTSVDGKPIDRLYREMEGFIDGSSEMARRRKFGYKVWLWPDNFDLGLANGRHAPIRRRAQTLGEPRSFPFPQGPVSTPKGVGYIQIRSFEQPSFEKAALTQLKALMGAKVILLDVRGNGGGSTPNGLIDALLDRSWRDFRYTTPLFNGHAGAENQVRKAFPQASADPYTKGYLDAFEEFRDAQMITPGTLHPAAPDAYHGKVYLLVDADCASACEDLVEPFKASGRGILVGEATAGSSGQPYYFDFGNGMSFRISSKRYYLPDGSPFEGVGLKPDVEVHLSLDDMKAGRDVVFLKAVELAAKN